MRRTKSAKPHEQKKPEKKILERTTTFPAKKADQKCIAQFKLIRKELNEHPGQYR